MPLRPPIIAVLDKAIYTFPLGQTQKKKKKPGLQTGEKIMSFSLSICVVLKGPLTKRRQKLGVSQPTLAFSFVPILRFYQLPMISFLLY